MRGTGLYICELSRLRCSDHKYLFEAITTNNVDSHGS